MKFVSLLLILVVGLESVVADQEISTTQKPDPSTTEPVTTTENHTTQEPTTTTPTPSKNPSTTTEPPTSTTTEPTTSTTHSPPTTPSPTHEPTTSTPSPHPTESTLGNYTITNENGGVCLVLLTRLTATQNETSVHFTNGKVYNSNCNDTTINLMIKFEEENASVNIIFTNNTKSYFISQLGVETNIFSGLKGNLTQFEVGTDKFYKCAKASEVSLGNSIHLIFSDMKYEAFRTSKTADFTRSEQECASDYHSDVVIIAIGCALALLVVIILVAYLIARRKNRQRGYQSV